MSRALTRQRTKVTNDAERKNCTSQNLSSHGGHTWAPGYSEAVRAMWWKDSASLKKRSAAAPFSMKWTNASLRSCWEARTAWYFPSPGSRPSASSNFTPDRTTSTQALTLKERRKMHCRESQRTLGCLGDNTMTSLPSQWCLLLNLGSPQEKQPS